MGKARIPPSHVLTSTKFPYRPARTSGRAPRPEGLLPVAATTKQGVVLGNALGSSVRRSNSLFHQLAVQIKNTM